MKRFTFPILLVVICTLVFIAATGNDRFQLERSSPATVLWKITGPDCSKPSYILGTFHLTDAKWILEYSEMKKVIDSTEFILNEAFTTHQVPIKPHIREVLKALPLLDKHQFRTLDSFFVARVGEGIKNNIDAENLTIAEMEGAILTTLASNSENSTAVTKLMDKELFDIYVELGREGDRLDRIPISDFDSSQIDHAKQYLGRALGYIKNSDKPGWNIYQMQDVDDATSRYKKMEFDYKLNESDLSLQTSTDFDFVPMEQRNKNWIPKIVENINKRPCLIAVGLSHLYYKTGLIMLLRNQGYRVEPVILTK
ncbi:TraB/GumN family protein [Dyadobacter sp. CY312]|uniref:TraB/GumN family protein n=1 Tax=Dyadobacter sp. CY312 TaxID=2907303 RepID=UPI001F1CFAE7|nr:TraB/GumN family protein [Dyadobacter sp. CY312]MCE7039291.1 TraB/GumN family protein [Dyadobacter sp. CY312]